jgi:hypothetical protein
MTNTATYTCGLVVARRDPTICQPISEALMAVGMTTQRLVTRDERPEEIIARADTEGGVPILVVWDARKPSLQLMQDLLACDTLPGRPYIMVSPSDVIGAVIAEELDQRLLESTDRVLVVSLPDLSLASTQELLRMHLSRSCASYLGRPRRARGIAPAPITEMPVGERNINNIERRVMQRGMFKVQALKIPRF